MITVTLAQALVGALLLAGASSAQNPLQGVENDLNNAVDGTNQTLQNAANKTGSAITGATKSTDGALQNATNTVGSSLDTGVNATQNATDGLANDGASLAAGVINTTGIVAAVSGPIASAIEGVIRDGVRHPVVFWPAFGTSRIRVDVSEQDVEPDCPSSGTFHVAFGNPTVLEGWSESCIYNLIQIEYDADVPDFNQRFSSRPGVNTTIADFGTSLCAPIPYAPFFLFFEAVGYSIGYDFFVACYDWRTSPYQDVNTDGPHLERAMQLVEEAYANTGLPVYLIGHSNGPLYALALLNSTSAAWRTKYIAGFIGYAGNWAGQGGNFAPIFSGQSLFDDVYYSSAAPAFESWPASYMQLADPAVFGDSEVVVQAPVDGESRNYSTADFSTLFEDANFTLAQELAPQLVGNLSVKTATPETHFYGFYGSGLQTVVGVTLPSLTQGVTPTSNGNFYEEGDSNQEATDNLSVLEWNTTQDSCFHFELNEEAGAAHLTLPLNPSVLQRTVSILFTAPKDCSQAAGATAG